MRTYLLVISLVVSAWLLTVVSGCGGGGTLVDSGGGQELSFTPQAVACPWDELTNMPRNTPVAVVANQAGMQVRQFSASLLSSYVGGGVKQSVCETVGGLQVGYGHSGTPVYTMDGRIIGALYSGIDGAKQFYVRHISEMLPLLNDNPTPLAARQRAVPAPLSPWVMRGVPGSYTDRITERLTSYHIIPITARGRQADARLAVSAPFPGSTIAVNILDGDVAQIQAFGTLTYSPDGKKWVAFGHALDQVGTRNLPISMASVDAISAGTWGTYKLCHSVGPTIGALTGDHAQGVVIDTSKAATTTPITTVLHYNGSTQTWHHQLAQDKGSYIERFGALIGMMDPLFSLDDDTSRQWIAAADWTFSLDDGTTQTMHVNGYQGQSPLYAAFNLTDNLYSSVYSPASGRSFTSLSITINLTPISLEPVQVTVKDKATNQEILPDATGAYTLATNASYVTTATVNGWSNAQVYWYLYDSLLTVTNDGFTTGNNAGTVFGSVSVTNNDTGQTISKSLTFNVIQKAGRPMRR